MNIEEFKARCASFIAKHGADAIMMADEERRAAMCLELEPLAKFAKMPAEKLLALIAKAIAEGQL